MFIQYPKKKKDKKPTELKNTWACSNCPLAISHEHIAVPVLPKIRIIIQYSQHQICKCKLMWLLQAIHFPGHK